MKMKSHDFVIEVQTLCRHKDSQVYANHAII